MLEKPAFSNGRAGNPLLYFITFDHFARIKTFLTFGVLTSISLHFEDSAVGSAPELLDGTIPSKLGKLGRYKGWIHAEIKFLYKFLISFK